LGWLPIHLRASRMVVRVLLVWMACACACRFHVQARVKSK
jgi:hypothetical protein